MKTRRGWLVKRGRTFYATWEVNHKRFQRSTGCTTEKEALKVLARVMEPFLVEDTKKTLENVKTAIERADSRLAEIGDGTPPLTLDKAWFAFEKSTARPDSGESTLRQYDAELRRFIRFMVKHHPGPVKDHPDQIVMRDISEKVAEAYAADLNEAKVSPSTFNQHLNFLALLWRTLAKDIKGKANPWEGITRKWLNPLASRKRALTAAQFDSLLAAAEADPEARDLILILAWTGLRLIDAVKLTFGAVDFAKRVLSVVPQKTARRTGKAVMIPLFPAALEVLNRRHGDGVMRPGRYVFPELAEDYERDHGANLSKRLQDIFGRAGMQTAEARAGKSRAVVVYGAHSLRHHFVSAASAAGLPAAMIKSITGHSTDQMLEHYQHIGAELAEEMARRIGDTKALPPAESARLIEADAIRAIVERLTPENADQIKAELIALTQ